MKTNLINCIAICAALMLGGGGFWICTHADSTTSVANPAMTQLADTKLLSESVIVDDNIRLCQGFEYAPQQCGCQGPCNGSCGMNRGVAAPMISGNGFAPGPIDAGFSSGGFGYGQPKMMLGVDDNTGRQPGRESRFGRGGDVPFDQFSYGGHIGPHRTPYVPEYRLRVNDQLEFVYLRTREKSVNPYQLYVGDVIDVHSATDENLIQQELPIRSDGKTTMVMIGEVMCEGKTIKDLQRELNAKYGEFNRDPQIVVQVRQSETPLQDIVDSVDARQGQGGQSRQAQVTADGTLALPAIGNVPAVGLTLNEIAREVNARYRLRLGGIEVTPILLERAPTFIYVLGEVAQPGRYPMTGPTSALQSIALAQGFNAGGNIRQIIVLRRDQNWRLTATKLDLAGALYGKRPQPSDEIWLQRDDIVIIPKKPIQRLSEAVNQYLSNTLYQIFPQQGVAFDFDGFTPL